MKIKRYKFSRKFKEEKLGYRVSYIPSREVAEAFDRISKKLNAIDRKYLWAVKGVSG